MGYRGEFKGLVAMASVLAACGGEVQDTSKAELIEPEISSKADSLNAVRVVDHLGFGATHEGVFDEDFQFFGLTFFAGETDSRISVEVTQKGSSRGLDTALFLYGERGNNDWTKLASDDDAGFGALSEIEGFRFEGEFRRYMIVVGTADAQGRGKFRVELRCDDDSCAAPAPEASCPDALFESMEECVAESFFEGETSEIAAMRSCSEASLAPDYFDSLCVGGAFFTPGAFCGAGFSSFESALMPSCSDKLFADSFPEGFTPLRRKTMSMELDEALFVAAESCSGFACFVEGELYGYDSESATLASAVAGVQDHQGLDPRTWGKAQLDLDLERELDFAGSELIAQIRSEFGDTLQVGSLFASRPVAAGAEEFISKTIIHAPSSKSVLVVTVVTGED